MIEQLQLFFKLGFTHVLDLGGYDHILFLTVLTVPFLFRDYKKIVQLVTLFTIGHTLSLMLSAYQVVVIDSAFVEFLIPVTIAIAALYNIFFVNKSLRGNIVEFCITLVFGVVHGLGFSNYFKMIISGYDEKMLPLLEFALGLEVAQILIVLVVLILGTTLVKVFNIAKKDWVLVMSAIVIGMTIPMLLTR